MESSAPVRSSSANLKGIASPLHTILVLAAIAILAYRGKLRSEHLRAVEHPDRVTLYLRTMLFQWLTLALVLVGLRLRGSSLFLVLGDRWRSFRQFFTDVGLAGAFWIVSTLVISILQGHGDGSASARSVQFLLPQTALEIFLWILLSITAGICEEAIYRGYLQRQFSGLTRNVAAGILLAAVAFGASHAYQGTRGAITIGTQGLLLGLLAWWRGTVRPGMLAHAWADVFAGALARLLKIPVG